MLLPFGSLILIVAIVIFITFADNDISNDVEVFLDFTSLQAMFTIFAKVSERAFMIFPLHGGCSCCIDQLLFIFSSHVRVLNMAFCITLYL